MDCLKPVSKVNQKFECGRCQPCVRYRRRVWTHRMMLEWKQHQYSSFVTLTYAPGNEPPLNSLDPLDVQNWLKELRHAIEPHKIRFFLSGEYGPVSERPHYHAIIFGLNSIVAGGLNGNGGLVAATWRKGFSSVRDVTESRCAYVAGYVDKKIAGKGVILNGRHREFTRMSMRPGIGRYAVDAVVAALSQGQAGTDSIQSTGDVPTALRHGRILLPLGRYMRGKIRDVLSDGATVNPVGTQYRQTLSQRLAFQRMLELQAADEIVARAEKKSRQEIMLDRLRQKSLNIAARERISKPRGEI